ncbi:MAG: hypothetical protein LC130_03855 [Bryobacterales bacterium]|nr:hypothetical protein [Bryobacterales bacterium]
MKACLIGQEPWGLRGGSWNNNQNNARVSDRNNNHPNNQWNNNGFRVVAVSPHNFAPAGSMFGPRIGIEAKLAGSLPGEPVE